LRSVAAIAGTTTVIATIEKRTTLDIPYLDSGSRTA
jgi:hypothetical protein